MNYWTRGFSNEQRIAQLKKKRETLQMFCDQLGVLVSGFLHSQKAAQFACSLRDVLVFDTENALAELSVPRGRESYETEMIYLCQRRDKVQQSLSLIDGNIERFRTSTTGIEKVVMPVFEMMREAFGAPLENELSLINDSIRSLQEEIDRLEPAEGRQENS